MSVTFAPRARIIVKASWPGVSRKTIFRPFFSTWYAPMCCVMPPASPAGDVGLADGVEQRGLAVVDVAHDGDDRTARHGAAAGFGALHRFHLDGFFERDDLRVDAELAAPLPAPARRRGAD